MSLGGHVENIFYLNDFMTWLVCKMLSDILFLRAGSSSFSLSICEEKSPYRVGRHVENSLRISNMASRGKTHTFGRHVEISFFFKKRVGNMAFCGVNRCLLNLMMLF